MRAAQDGTVQHAGQGQVVDELDGARHEGRVFDAVDRLADVALGVVGHVLGQGGDLDRHGGVASLVFSVVQELSFRLNQSFRPKSRISFVARPAAPNP